MEMLIQDDPPFLPDEIIRDILKGLPVKSLIRLQCVSKRWKNIIKSPSFIAQHLKHHRNQYPRLLFKERADDPLSLIEFDHKIQALVHRPKPSFMSKWLSASIVGSCNGLICVRYARYARSHTSLLIWNPATTEVRWIPGVIDGKLGGAFYFGFGFNPILNDYKIVKIFISNANKRVDVYSLNTGSWKEVKFENIENVRVFRVHASFNGSIFWTVWNSGEELNGMVSFDLSKEVFTLLPLPVLDVKSDVLRVFEHYEKLFLVRYTNNGLYESDFHFWVMEEGEDASGKTFSWTKMDDNTSFNLSFFEVKIGFIWEHHNLDQFLYYIESLVPVGNNV